MVVDGNKDAGSFRNVTATGSFIIGSADMNETDLEKLDGITNGTVAANKAVVVDGNLDASSFRNLTASGAITSASFVTTGNAITIADNEITTGSSNADINITPHGTGKVVIKSLDVNEITSTDSSAIQIVDALNVSGRVTSATGFTGDVVGLSLIHI